jgi:hypothetical protein
VKLSTKSAFLFLEWLIPKALRSSVPIRRGVMISEMSLLFTLPGATEQRPSREADNSLAS